MSTKRLVDAALVALVLVVLGAGAGYWIAAAPESSELRLLKNTVAQQLSYVEGNRLFETVTLAEQEEASWPVSLDPDVSYVIQVLCAGDGAVEIVLRGTLVPAICDPAGAPTQAPVADDGRQTMIAVRAVSGDPLVVAIQVVPN